MRLRPMLALLLPALACAAHDARAGGPVFWVGAAAPCNFNSLQTAIGAVPDGSEIRLARNQAYADVSAAIDDKSLLISGGWDDCGDTSPDGTTTLVGNDLMNQPVFTIGSAVTPRLVVLRRLHVTGGHLGGVALSGYVELHVERSVVDGNEADVGGGIRVDGVSRDDTVLRMSGTLIGGGAAGNSATTGGGIACAHATVSLGGSAIVGNQAQSEGGGLFLDDCLLRTSPSGYDFDELGVVSLWIGANTAATNGGGVLAQGGSRLEFEAPPGAYAIDGNLAQEGAGLLLRGSGTQLTALGLTLSNNVALQRGGAASLHDGAQFTMQRLLPMQAGIGVAASLCGAPVECNLVRANRAETYTGGAFYVQQASLTLRQTVVEGNYSGNGSALLLVDSVARIENSVLRGNDGDGGPLARVIDGSSLVLNASTIAGNPGQAALIQMFSEGGANNLHLRNGIIWQPGTTVLQATPVDTVSSVCMNAHEAESIDAVVHEPGFVDAEAGDYRLPAGSPNIDACGDPLTGPAPDLLGRARPVDLAPDAGEGDFDRGAWELPDRIFADGFEGVPDPLPPSR